MKSQPRLALRVVNPRCTGEIRSALRSIAYRSEAAA